MADAVAWYEMNAAQAAAEYERLPFETVHTWLLDRLPKQPGLVLDVGAGSGRDAAALAARGFEVVAVEPSAAMLDAAQQRHPDARIRWLKDRLPGLDAVFRLGLSFDLILLSAVWMHVLPAARSRAFRKMITLLKPGGFIALTLRNPPAEPERAMHPVSVAEIERLAREHGALIEMAAEDDDHLGRKDVRWHQLIVRFPDDGTGALPLLRHVVLNDAKSSTYKLALLRVVARIADGASGMARFADDEHVAVPLGLAALFWLRLFKPLIQADLPQTPSNRGVDGLGFAGKGFRALGAVSHRDLRVGARFSGETASALHQALGEACDTITKMPAFYMTYPGGGQIMKTRRAKRLRRPASIMLEEAYLSTFGELLVPINIWRALARFDVWIEPALIAEWIRLMRYYAERQGRHLDDGSVATAMTWSEPTRDVATARKQALLLIAEERKVFCIWSGRSLSQESLDVDHCLPWAAWPCDDLWNLLPAHRTINQREKRDRLPSAARLRAAQELIEDWWNRAYVGPPSAPLATRFYTEARASLPTLAVQSESADVSDVFAAVSLRRLNLKQDQGVPEWDI